MVYQVLCSYVGTKLLLKFTMSFTMKENLVRKRAQT